MGPTRKRDVTGAAVVAAVISYVAVELLYRWFPPITVWTGVWLLVAAIAEAAWGRYVGAKIDQGQIELDYAGTVDGDVLTGKVKSPFGEFDLKGSRTD